MIIRFVSCISLALLVSCGGSGGNTGVLSSGPTLDASNSGVSASCQTEHNQYGNPANSNQVLCRLGYAVGYNYSSKVADWVSYQVTAESANAQIARTDDFREDLDLPSQARSTLSDFSGSGYDRGHLAPAATVGFSRTAMSQSFLLSNMAPQLPEFNRGGWSDLESGVRTCANKVGALSVVAGPIYEQPVPSTIGAGVRVATSFYMLIMKDSAPRQAVAFIVPHRAFAIEELPDFAVPVDRLEQKLSYDFFNKLPVAEQAAFENNAGSFCDFGARPSTGVTSPPASSQPVAPAPSTSPFGACGTKRTCGSMTSCSEARYFYQTCNVSSLDGDKDGTPCEQLCR
jgi:endonuclease G